jgi:hypothetical protein
MSNQFYRTHLVSFLEKHGVQPGRLTELNSYKLGNREATEAKNVKPIGHRAYSYGKRYQMGSIELI